MKESIESILAIDQMTKDLEEKTKENLDQLQKRYHKAMADMELDRARLAKEKALKAYEARLESFNQEMNSLKARQKERLKRMDRSYTRVKEDLLDQCFKDLSQGRQHT